MPQEAKKTFPTIADLHASVINVTKGYKKLVIDTRVQEGRADYYLRLENSRITDEWWED